MSTIEFRQLFDRSSCTYTYLLVCPITREAVLIDPVLECTARDLDAVAGMNATLKYVINTHVHADHITGSGSLKSQVDGLRSIVSKASGAVADILVEHGDHIKFGEKCALTVKATPGHTPGCVSLLLSGDLKSMIFTGDTVLIRGCGRTDFQGGNPDTLYDSVMREIFSLHSDTIIWPGHDYSGRSTTSVGEEKANNPRLNKNKEDFIDLMQRRFDGTKYPGAIDLALPANMVCGVFEEGIFDAASTPVKHPDGFVWRSALPPSLVKSDRVLIAKQLKSNGVAIIDFRSADEIAKDPGMPNSIHLPSGLDTAANNAAAAVEAGTIPPSLDTPILAYCASGRRAGIGCHRLQELGYSNCINGGNLSDVSIASATMA